MSRNIAFFTKERLPNDMYTALQTPHLPLGEYRLNFRYEPPLRFPPYPGFAWRGAFGVALKSTVCVVRPGHCGECLLRHNCAYSLIFETPLPPGAAKMRRYDKVPHPFALRIEAEPDRNSGEYRLGLNLFGRANAQFPYVLHALRKAGETGIGSARQPFLLLQAEQSEQGENWRIIFDAAEGSLNTGKAQATLCPAMPERIRLSLLTPLRSKMEGDLATPTAFRFHHLFGPLLRRISMLTAFHTDTPLETDFAGLVALSKSVELDGVDLRWRELTRYSSRQQTEMQMGGLLGAFELNMMGLEPLWPYLWLGRQTLVGKGASMGLGAYRIDAASLPRMATT